MYTTSVTVFSFHSFQNIVIFYNQFFVRRNGINFFVVFDGINATAIFKFKNIVFRNVAVPALVECVNAEVTIDGGLFRKKHLSSKELQDRINNIENNKNLLH